MEFNIGSNCNEMDYYRQGASFAQAAWRCLGQENDAGGVDFANDGVIYVLPAPCVVNASFACEMFFKSLLTHFDITYPKGKDGHNLYSLYDLLPENMKMKIASFCLQCDECDQFESILKEHAEDFVDIRYFIENKGLNPMSPLTMITIATNLETIIKYEFANDNYKNGDNR